MPTPKVQFFTDSGLPLAGGLVYTYEPGTTNNKASYTDSTGATANTNPVVLDSAGRASIWLSGFYRIDVYTSAGALVYSVDNVSSMSASSTTTSQWMVQGFALTYIGATQFSVPGDQTATLPAGTRIQATVTAGTITGTITASSAGGAPVITTVTVLWDSGALDTGLSAIYTGIITVTTSSMPILPVLAKTASYPLTMLDINKICTMTSATAQSFTLPAANAVPSGAWYRIKNLGAGILTVVGTVDGTTNPTMSTNEDALIYSNGTAWYKSNPSSAMIRDVFRNLRIVNSSSASNIKLDITCDEVVCQNTSSQAVRVTMLSQIADITITGVNGLDTGAEASSTWYHIWAIATADLTARVLLSVSSDAPTLPAGYTHRAYLGAVYNNAASNLYPITQWDKRVVTESITVLSGGIANTPTSVSLAGAIPLTAKQVFGVAIVAVPHYIGVASTLSSLGLIYNWLNAGIAGPIYEPFIVPVVTPQSVFYVTDGAGANGGITISGWEY